MPDPQKLLTTIRQATQAFRKTPGRAGGLLRIQNCEEVIVAGDLHGNLNYLAKLLSHAKLKEHPRRHLVLQELIHGESRYPDGSDNSHRLLDLLAALKCQFPQQVHFLLGNHELAQWKDRRIGKKDECYNDIFRQGVHFAYGRFGEEIYAEYGTLFAASSLGILTPNRVFLSHSIPPERFVDPFELSLLEDETWHNRTIDGNSPIYHLVWGRDYRESTTVAFLRKTDADFVITGHHPCEEGFAFPHSFQMVLDAMDVPVYACRFSTEVQPAVDEFRKGLFRLDQ